MKKGEDYTGVVITFCCHDGKGNYVFDKRGVNARDEQGTWETGGGGLEFRDTIEDTIRKEVTEEYGTDVISYEFLGYRDVHREQKGKNTHWVALDFKVLVDPTKVKNGEPHKFDEVTWFRMNALPSRLHSQFPKFFEQYKELLT